MMGEVWDYLSICGVLVVPLLVGIVHGVRGNPNLPYSFVFGHKEISLLKTALSTAALTIGPVILFLLSELELPEGFTWVLAGVGYLLALVIVVIFVAPILHYGRSPSIFQYLEERYRSKHLKNFSVVVFSIVNILFSSTILSICAGLLAQTIPIQSWLLAILLGTVTTFSVITGGLGASIDLNSVLLPFFGITTFAISIGLAFLKSDATIGTVEFAVDFDVFSHEPNVFVVLPFSFVTAIQVLGTSQILYQNFAPAVTKRRARLSLALSSPLVFIAGTLCVLTGVLLRQLYVSCRIQSEGDPYVNLDQGFAVWTKGVPALKGALIGGVATFGISFIASSALGMATTLWEDILSPRLAFKKEKRQVLAVQVLITTLSVVITAVAATNLAVVTDSWRFYRQIFIISSSIMTPLSAVFLAGMFFPCCNSKGASLALCIGLLITTAFGAGNLAFRINERKNAFQDICQNRYQDNSTLATSIPVTWAPMTRNTVTIPPTAPTVPIFSTTVPSVSRTSALPLITTTSESTQPTTTGAPKMTTQPSTDSSTTTAQLVTRPRPSSSSTVAPVIITITNKPTPVQSTTPQIVFSEDFSENRNSSDDTELLNNATTVEFIAAFQKKSAIARILSVRSETSPAPEENDPVWQRMFQISLLFHPIIGLLLTLFLTLVLSLATGGQDIYALDWNLVYWTCNNCTQRLTYGGNTTLQRRRKPRFNKAPYVHSESFRYARHGPLPDSSYRNPRVSQMMESTMQTKIQDETPPSSSHFGGNSFQSDI